MPGTSLVWPWHVSWLLPSLGYCSFLSAHVFSSLPRQWYNESSILRQPGAFSAVVNDLYDLNDIQFDLAPSGHELDTAWPSFARSAIGVGLYLWNPPTRSSSMASINSQVSKMKKIEAA